MVITGASSSLGLAPARYSLSRGYNVAAAARSPAPLETLATEVPVRMLATCINVTAPGEARIALAAARGRFRGLEVLVNNAGSGIVGAVEKTPEDELRA